MKTYPFLRAILLTCLVYGTLTASPTTNAEEPSGPVIPSVTLNDGMEVPILGFGTLYLREELGVASVSTAIELGYRLLDTATIYGNEEAVGEGIVKSGIARDQLFVSTKVWVDDTGLIKTRQALTTSLEKLGLDFVDLYLIHRPRGDIMGAWKAMEALHKEGKIRAIGVSNFSAEQLADLIANAEIKPVLNQIEVSPFFQQHELQAAIEQLGVRVQAWSPFAQGRNGLFTNEVLVGIGNKHGKTAAQVTLRWLVQRGIIAIPRSSNPEHMAENLDIFDFELSAEEMALIRTLDTGKSQFPEWE